MWSTIFVFRLVPIILESTTQLSTFFLSLPFLCTIIPHLTLQSDALFLLLVHWLLWLCHRISSTYPQRVGVYQGILYLSFDIMYKTECTLYWQSISIQLLPLISLKWPFLGHFILATFVYYNLMKSSLNL